MPISPDRDLAKRFFYRSTPDGAIRTFDVPGAGTGAGQGTVPYDNNPAGAIAGYYVDASNAYHGLVRNW